MEEPPAAVIVFENNGYWFEGEEANEGPLAPGFTRRRIKKHQDVQLVVANYIWYGMFDSLTLTLDAEHPYRAEFSLSFLAWKERTRQSSPYSQWGIQNNVERGHSYGAKSYPAEEQAPPDDAGQLTVLPAAASPGGLSALSSLAPSVLPAGAVPPAVASDQGVQYLVSGGGSATPNLGLLNPVEVFA